MQPVLTTLVLVKLSLTLRPPDQNGLALLRQKFSFAVMITVCHCLIAYNSQGYFISTCSTAWPLFIVIPVGIRL